jgi:hypothetical protein
MAMIDDEKLSNLGQLHQIDKINTKITGSFILKSFIQLALTNKPISLRTIEAFSKNNKMISGELKAKNIGKKTVDHSSVGKRLASINVDFFKDVYEDLVVKFNDKFNKTANFSNFHIFDSTIITISTKLMKGGLNLGGGSDDAHIKMSISLKNSIPNSVRFCSTQSESSEDIALVAAINEAKLDKENILLFDRGISKGETFDKFTKEEKFFITRVNVNRKHKVIKANEIAQNKDGDLTINSDEEIYLIDKKGKEIKEKLRIVKAKKQDGIELWFLTNVLHLSAQEVASAYKSRWEIEVLFKFLKQHLQFKKFLSHCANGMKVYIYCLLIAAILFSAYKITNKLSGYKIAMFRFMMDFNKEIIKDIVLFCGGDPSLVDLKL